MTMTLAQATEHLKDELQPDGGLYSVGWYLGWPVNDSTAILDGDFTADDLEAIAVYMRGNTK